MSPYKSSLLYSNFQKTILALRIYKTLQLNNSTHPNSSHCCHNFHSAAGSWNIQSPNILK